MGERIKRAVVTGATSFIGINLLNRLLTEGYEVTGIIRPNTSKRDLLPSHPGLAVKELDLSNYNCLSDTLTHRPDVFFSLAWNGTRAPHRDDYDLQYWNYKYSIDGLKSILSTGCKKVITAGSQAQYGVYNQKITEETPELPITEYGKHKLKFYREAKVICESMGVSLKEPRFFSVYGPHDFEDTMIISIIKLMISGKPCPLTQGIQMWDFLYIKDAVEAIIYLAQVQCTDGVYNLGSGIAKPLKEYLYEMRDILSSKSELLFGEVQYPKTGMVSIEPDISKIINQTGWYPKVSFEEGVLEILKSLKE